MIRWRLFIFSLLLCVIFCAHVSKNTPYANSVLDCHRTYSPAELTEDFQILIRTLEAAHPDLYRVNPKVIIDERIAAIQSQLNDSLSYLEFLKLIAPLLTDIGDFSTQWGHSREYIEYRNENIPLFPLSLTIEGERVFVKENFSSNDTIQQGDELLAINGVSIAEYWQLNYPLLPIDGKIRSIQHRWLEMAFPKHHSNFWEQADSFRLQVRSPTGNRYSATVQAVLNEKILPPKPHEKLPLQLTLKGNKAHLSISTFNTRQIQAFGQDYEVFLAESFRQIKDQQITVLTLDLKDNAWGELMNGAKLLQYLSSDSFQYVQVKERTSPLIFPYPKQVKVIESLEDSLKTSITQSFTPQTTAYAGELHIITNGWNVQAGGYFCAKVSTRPKTYFYGEQAGTSLFGMNAGLISLALPHTRLSFYIPTVQYIANEEHYKDVQGIPLHGTAP